MYKVITIVLLFLLAAPVIGEDIYSIDCSQIDNEASFSIKGNMKHSSNANFLGIAHSFRVNEEFSSSEKCRIPWYEKFPLSGNFDVKFHYHEHEYMEGCVLRFVFSEGAFESRMWVYQKDNPYKKGIVAKANCNVSKKS